MQSRELESASKASNGNQNPHGSWSGFEQCLDSIVRHCQSKALRESLRKVLKKALQSLGPLEAKVLRLGHTCLGVRVEYDPVLTEDRPEIG